MEHGVNVIVEKPLEIRLDRIDRMIDEAVANKVKLAYISSEPLERGEPGHEGGGGRGAVRPAGVGGVLHARGTGRTSITRRAGGAGLGHSTAAGRS